MRLPMNFILSLVTQPPPFNKCCVFNYKHLAIPSVMDVAAVLSKDHPCHADHMFTSHSVPRHVFFSSAHQLSPLGHMILSASQDLSL